MEATWMHLDRDYRLLHVTGAHAPGLEPHVGKILWDVFPDEKDKYLPVYERAWDAGYTHEWVHCRGVICTVNCSIIEDRLVVCAKVWTVDGIREALEALELELTAPAAR